MEIPELTIKIKALSQEDYEMVVMLVNRLASKPSDVLKTARKKYLEKNPMSMEEIEGEIEKYRSEKQE